MANLLKFLMFFVLTTPVFAQKPYDVKISHGIDIGSGTIIDTNGSFSVILTAQHVISDGNGPIRVLAGAWFTAQVLGEDSTRDLALLAIPAPNRPTYPKFRDPKVGESYFFAGYPNGHYGTTWKIRTPAKYSNAPDSGPDLAAYDGTITGGFSGGRVVSKDGYIVGVISAANETETFATKGSYIEKFVEETSLKYKQWCRGGNCLLQNEGDRYVYESESESESEKYKELSDSEKYKELSEKYEEKYKELSEKYEELSEKYEELSEKCSGEYMPALEARISALENGTITFEYLNGDGSIFDSETVKLGDTLKINPITVRRSVKGYPSVSDKVPWGGVIQLWDAPKE